MFLKDATTHHRHPRAPRTTTVPPSRGDAVVTLRLEAPSLPHNDGVLMPARPAVDPRLDGRPSPMLLDRETLKRIWPHAAAPIEPLLEGRSGFHGLDSLFPRAHTAPARVRRRSRGTGR